MKNALQDLQKQYPFENKLCSGYLDGSISIWFDEPKYLSEITCEYCQKPMLYSCLDQKNDWKRVALCGEKHCSRPRPILSHKEPTKPKQVNWQDYGLSEIEATMSLENYRFKSEKSLLRCEDFITNPSRRLWLFWGEVRAGKTHLAIGIMKRFYEKTGQNIRFITHSEMYFQVKEVCKNGGEEQLLSKFANIPFMAIDDLGVLRGTPNEIDMTYELFSRRFKRNGKTIFTTNKSPEELEAIYGARFMGRFGEAGSMQRFTRRTETAQNSIYA